MPAAHPEHLLTSAVPHMKTKMKMNTKIHPALPSPNSSNTVTVPGHLPAIGVLSFCLQPSNPLPCLACNHHRHMCITKIYLNHHDHPLNPEIDGTQVRFLNLISVFSGPIYIYERPIQTGSPFSFHICKEHKYGEMNGFLEVTHDFCHRCSHVTPTTIDGQHNKLLQIFLISEKSEEGESKKGEGFHQIWRFGQV